MFVKNSVHIEKLVRLTQQNSLVGYWKIKFLIGRTNFLKIKQKNSVSTDFFCYIDQLFTWLIKFVCPYINKEFY